MACREMFLERTASLGASWVSLLRLTPRTGRTHQIRVHLADLGYPLIGDKVYGRKRPNAGIKNGDVSNLELFSRQALHAERLSILHPRTSSPLEFYAPLAEDMESLLKILEDQDLECRKLAKSTEGLTRREVLLSMELRN